jgi:hypothetical protein
VVVIASEVPMVVSFVLTAVRRTLGPAMLLLQLVFLTSVVGWLWFWPSTPTPPWTPNGVKSSPDADEADSWVDADVEVEYLAS